MAPRAVILPVALFKIFSRLTSQRNSSPCFVLRVSRYIVSTSCHTNWSLISSSYRKSLEPEHLGPAQRRARPLRGYLIGQPRSGRARRCTGVPLLHVLIEPA